ncbi:MAG: hypothetical protein U0270_31620 [Labilithrix sp.]
MTQQQPSQLLVREEERVLGIAYDRAVPAVPKLVKKAIGAEVEELGDGYWIAAVKLPGGIKREVTVRLGKQGPDTRFAVRAETTSMGRTFLLTLLVVGIVTFGIGILPLIPWITARQRSEQRERDLLVHKTFRAIEDAVAEQGVAPGYRVAPGEGAVVERASHDEADEAEDDPGAAAQARGGAAS